VTPSAVLRRWLALPLTAWVGLLCGGAVLCGLATTAVLLRAADALSPDAAVALAAGGMVGLLLVGLAVLGAARLAAALRELRSYAVAGLDEAGPLQAGRTGTTRELAELAKVVDALHLRVRVAEELGERYRREALTAGAGVFELVSGLVAAEEGARGQLAAELHDTVAQSLMIASGVLAGGPLTPEQLVRVSDHVLDAEEQVRALMARTRPPALRDGDLASAVDGLRADLQARYALTVHVQWPAQAHPLPLASAVTVYRFFQEALLNVVKHADVDDAQLRLEVSADAVVATVRDEGPGFDPQAVRPDRGRHVGLSLLRERARLSGGTLEVDSAEGADTVLTLRLPRSARGSAPVGLVAAPVPAADLVAWPVPLVAVAPATGARPVPLAS
jgi:signal transduction histidine kinase